MNDDDEGVLVSFTTQKVDEQKPDSIAPLEIEHQVDEVIVDGKLEQQYNHFVYHFENGEAYCWARAYSDHIDEVSIFGPFISCESLDSVDAPEFYNDILEYLKRRFGRIDALGEEGYKTVWQHPNFIELD